MDRITITPRGMRCFWVTRYVGELSIGVLGNPTNLSGQFKLENFCRCTTYDPGEQPPIRRITQIGSDARHIYVEGQISSIVCMGCKSEECPCEGEDPVFYVKSKNYMLGEDDVPADLSMDEFWFDDLVKSADSVKCPCNPPGTDDPDTPPQA